MEEKNSGYTILTTDKNKIFTCNSSSSQTFTLPSVSSSEIGFECMIVKLGAGKITITAVDSDTIEDSGTAGSIYCEDDGYAFISIMLITSTQWIIKWANGTWITTV